MLVPKRPTQPLASLVVKPSSPKPCSKRHDDSDNTERVQPWMIVAMPLFGWRVVDLDIHRLDRHTSPHRKPGNLRSQMLTIGIESDAVGEPLLRQQGSSGCPNQSLSAFRVCEVAETTRTSTSSPKDSPLPSNTAVLKSLVLPATHPSGRLAGPSTRTSTTSPI